MAQGLNGGRGEAKRRAHDELTVRVFRALYREFDLYTVSSTHVVVPKGTPWFAGASLGSIAQQISEHERDETALLKPGVRGRLKTARRVRERPLRGHYR